MKTGKYPYFSEVGFVTKGEPKGTTKRFIDYVASPEGEKILENYGMAGVK